MEPQTDRNRKIVFFGIDSPNQVMRGRTTQLHDTQRKKEKRERERGDRKTPP
jgi:hypothetical protein